MSTPIASRRPPQEVTTAWESAIASGKRTATTAVFEHFIMVAGDLAKLKARITPKRTITNTSKEKDLASLRTQFGGALPEGPVQMLRGT
eukprot:6177100-Alexandrium_andersonii.AAC.1